MKEIFGGDVEETRKLAVAASLCSTLAIAFLTGYCVRCLCDLWGWVYAPPLYRIPDIVVVLAGYCSTAAMFHSRHDLSIHLLVLFCS